MTALQEELLFIVNLFYTDSLFAADSLSSENDVRMLLL